MHEHEFRLVVCSPTSFLPFLASLGYSEKSLVCYAKPHFRWRDWQLETKRAVSTLAVYHDGLWFRWVHSIETPVHRWSVATKRNFLHATGNFQQPFRAERRDVLRLDDHAQLYTFQDRQEYRLVLEWECHGKPQQPAELLTALSAHASVYHAVRDLPPPPFTLSEELARKPVVTVDSLPAGCLYAHKLDGTFGIVISYPDRVKQKWEDYECVVQPNATLGNGLVFAAERLDSGEVYLLDVYRAQGHETASWCRRAILTELLPRLALLPGYFVQQYVTDLKALDPDPKVKVDGLIGHDVEKDVIYKWKPEVTLDLVHEDGYFLLPNGRIQCKTSGLENGAVYEISITDASVIRKRKDRFKGNTLQQIKNVMKHERFQLKILPNVKEKKLKRK